MTAKLPIFDFLRSRGARMSCPFCGHENWHGWDERVTLDHVIGSGTARTGGARRSRSPARTAASSGSSPPTCSTTHATGPGTRVAPDFSRWVLPELPAPANACSDCHRSRGVHAARLGPRVLARYYSGTRMRVGQTASALASPLLAVRAACRTSAGSGPWPWRHRSRSRSVSSARFAMKSLDANGDGWSSASARTQSRQCVEQKLLVDVR